MLILAFDTTSRLGGAGIYRDVECLTSVANEATANRYSVALFEMVNRLLADAQSRLAVPSLSVRDMDVFAVANGPGSFTGIRAGVAAAQAWGRACERPVLGVSVFEALVAQAQPEAEQAVSILDAHRGEFYVELFRIGEPRDHSSAGIQDGAKKERPYVPEGEGWLLQPDALAALLAARLPAAASTVCLTREHDAAALALRDQLPRSLLWQQVQGTLVPGIARRALEAHRQGKLQSPAELDAYYIRRSDAEMNWKG